MGDSEQYGGERSGGGLQKIGAFWKAKPGSKALVNGQIEIDGKKMRVGLYENNHKTKDTSPDYTLLLYPPKD